MRLNTMFVLICLSCSPLLAQESKSAPDDASVPIESEEKPLDFWMEKKLEYSTGILKGLSMGDFELIETNAKQMRMLNRIEGFVRSRNSDYRTNVHTFERVTDEVIRHASKQNIDGVVLAYHQLTMSCVRCHQSLREPNGSDEPDDAIPKK